WRRASRSRRGVTPTCVTSTSRGGRPRTAWPRRWPRPNPTRRHRSRERKEAVMTPDPRATIPLDPPRPALEPIPPAPPTPPPAADDGEETDVALLGYSGRALAPGWLAVGLLAALLWRLGPWPGDWLAAGLLGSAALWQLVRWGYRVAAVRYRLTTRRLFV